MAEKPDFSKLLKQWKKQAEETENQLGKRNSKRLR